jgi:hypothetical protein
MWGDSKFTVGAVYDRPPEAFLDTK